MSGNTAFMERHPALRFAVGMLIGVTCVSLTVGAVYAVVQMRPLERLPFARPTPTAPAPAAAPVAARFNVAHASERLLNAGMVARWTTAGDEQIYIEVTPEQITMLVGRAQDAEAALALVPMLFTETAAGQLAQQVARALMLEAGCNGAKAAGDVMVTAQVRAIGQGAVCEVVFA